MNPKSSFFLRAIWSVYGQMAIVAIAISFVGSFVFTYIEYKDHQTNKDLEKNKTLKVAAVN